KDAIAIKDGFVRLPRSFVTRIMGHLTECEIKCALTAYLETIGRDLSANTIPKHLFQKYAAKSRSAVGEALRTLEASHLFGREQRRTDNGDLTASIYRPTLMPTYEKKNNRVGQQSGPGRPVERPRVGRENQHGWASKPSQVGHQTGPSSEVF